MSLASCFYKRQQELNSGQILSSLVHSSMKVRGSYKLLKINWYSSLYNHSLPGIHFGQSCSTHPSQRSMYTENVAQRMHRCITAEPVAMVRPVRFWGRKNGVTWILTYTCVIEWPLRRVCRSLGRLRGLLRTFSSLQASKVATRELRLLNFLYNYIAILECETSVPIGEGLTCASARFNRLSSYRNYRWGDSSSILVQKWRSQSA